MELTTKNITNEIKELTITSLNGQKIVLLNVGASLTEWVTSSGLNIVAGYKDYRDYQKPGMYLGTNVGMNAGRIENGEFVLDGKKYHPTSDHPHFLHWGNDSLAFRVFDVSVEKNTSSQTVICFTHHYINQFLFGDYSIQIRYYIIEGSVRIVYDVSSNEKALCNLTNHSYFNLDGSFDSSLASHELKIKSKKVVLVNEDIIGKDLINVKDTEFDFTISKPIMPVIDKIKSRGEKARGLDHYFVFDKVSTEAQITLKSKKTNLQLNVFTTYPGVTIYTTNYPSKNKLKHGYYPAEHSGICLEVQFQSNAVNDSRFSLGVVSPDKPYHHEIYYQLGGQ